MRRPCDTEKQSEILGHVCYTVIVTCTESPKTVPIDRTVPIDKWWNKDTSSWETDL